MKKRARSLMAALILVSLGLGITTAVAMAAMRTIEAVDYMGLA